MIEIRHKSTTFFKTIKIFFHFFISNKIGKKGGVHCLNRQYTPPQAKGQLWKKNIFLTLNP